MEHMLGGGCAMVAHALNAFAINIQLDLSVQATKAQNALAVALLLWPQPHAKRAQATAIFNSIVWFHLINSFQYQPGSQATAPKVIDRLTRRATLSWVMHRHKPSSTSTYGSAGRRTPAQEAAAVALADHTIDAIDHNYTVVAYTDGASQGNPGPSGAGAIITYPKWGAQASMHTEELSAGLGTGTNNLGELWAVGMVLEDVASNLQGPPGLRISSRWHNPYGQCLRPGLPRRWLGCQGRQRPARPSPPGRSRFQPNLVDHRMSRRQRGRGPSCYHTRGAASSAAGRVLSDLPDRIATSRFKP